MWEPRSFKHKAAFLQRASVSLPPPALADCTKPWTSELLRNPHGSCRPVAPQTPDQAHTGWRLPLVSADTSPAAHASWSSWWGRWTCTFSPRRPVSALAAVPTQTLANCPVPSGTREHLDRDQSWGRTQQLENLSLPPAEGKALALRADSPHPGLTGGQLAADWSWVPRGDPVSCWAMTSRGGPKDSCDGVAV